MHVPEPAQCSARGLVVVLSRHIVPRPGQDFRSRAGRSRGKGQLDIATAARLRAFGALVGFFLLDRAGICITDEAGGGEEKRAT